MAKKNKRKREKQRSDNILAPSVAWRSVCMRESNACWRKIEKKKTSGNKRKKKNNGVINNGENDISISAAALSISV